MKKLIPSIWKIIIILLFVGCVPQKTSSPTPAEPTADIPAIRTEVAQTVVAGVTYEAALILAVEPTITVPPPDTPIPPTSTDSPSEPQAEEPTPTEITIPPTVTKTSTQVVQVVYPTLTPTFYPDRGELVSQSPTDGTYFGPGQDFDLVFTIRNIGVRPWNTNFYLKYTSGVMGQTHSGNNVTMVFIPGAVAYGDTVSLVIDMVAPLQAGTYASSWALINDDGTAFFWPNLVFHVSE